MVIYLAAGLGILVVSGMILIAGSILKNGVPVLEEPGFATRLSTYMSTNVAETREGHPFPELRPRLFPVDPPELWDDLLRAVDLLGWEVEEKDAASMKLHAVITTPMMGYRDDMRIQVAAANGSSSSLQIRSQSRVGKGDLGANLSHVLQLYKALETAGAPSETG